MASEGSSYIVDTIIHADPIIYVAAIIILIIAIIVFRKFSPKRDFRPKRLLVFFVIFIVLHLAAPLSLGFANSHLKWSSFKNPRNVYNSYSDSNKSMRVSGLYEYSFRNFYITSLFPKKISSEDKEFFECTIRQKDYKNKEEYKCSKGKKCYFLRK